MKPPSSFLAPLEVNLRALALFLADDRHYPNPARPRWTPPAVTCSQATTHSWISFRCRLLPRWFRAEEQPKTFRIRPENNQTNLGPRLRSTRECKEPGGAVSLI
jgi:hypothetical protein